MTENNNLPVYNCNGYKIVSVCISDDKYDLIESLAEDNNLLVSQYVENLINIGINEVMCSSRLIDDFVTAVKESLKNFNKGES